MSKKPVEKRITRGVRKEINNIVRIEVFKAWDKVKTKLKTPNDYMATVNLFTDTENSSRLVMVFVDEKQKFDVIVPEPQSHRVVIVAFDGKEVMMLDSEAKELLKKVEHTHSGILQ